MRLLTFLILAFCSTYLNAQTYSWQDFVEGMQDDEYGEMQDWADHMEELAQLHAHPIDINTATREDLAQLPMLDEDQIEEIHTYIFLHRGMRSLSELMAIESLDYQTRRILSLFLYCDSSVFEYKDTVTLSRLLKHAKHEIVTRMDIPLYYREGYNHTPENGGYKGGPIYNKVQYRLQSMNHLQLGVKAEKDAGEPFAGNRGYDSYGAYLMIKDIKCLRRAVVGDYKLGFGEGLVVNNGFSGGKSMFYSPIQGIRAHTGMDETNFFRGAAATLHYRNIDFTAWVSARRLDATKDEDGNVITLVKSGLHRTLTELDKKGNTRCYTSGGDITWRKMGLVVGVNGYISKFDCDLLQNSADYRRYYPCGDVFGVMGLHYGYTRSWFAFSGEGAYNTEKKGVATLNKLSFRINPRYTLSAWQRYYDKKYYSFYASAITENSSVQNESGLTVRLDASPLPKWNMYAYADFFYNPWPRYSMTHSSSGQDFLIQSSYEINRRHQISFRYQMKRKEQSDKMLNHNRLRLKYTFSPNNNLRLQTMSNMHVVNGDIGMALTQNVRYSINENCRVTGSLTYFNTPNYDTRVYLYEPALQGTFSFPSFFYHGIRAAITARYAMWNQRLIIEAKIGSMCYFDRTVQSSGMQQISSRWKDDVSIQFRLKI